VTEEEGKKLAGASVLVQTRIFFLIICCFCAERMKMTFFETSAASSGNVDQAFLELARLVKDRISDCGTPYPDQPTVKVVDMSKPVCSGGLACGSCRPL